MDVGFEGRCGTGSLAASPFAASLPRDRRCGFPCADRPRRAGAGPNIAPRLRDSRRAPTVVDPARHGGVRLPHCVRERDEPVSRARRGETEGDGRPHRPRHRPRPLDRPLSRRGRSDRAGRRRGGPRASADRRARNASCSAARHPAARRGRYRPTRPRLHVRDHGARGRAARHRSIAAADAAGRAGDAVTIRAWLYRGPRSKSRTAVAGRRTDGARASTPHRLGTDAAQLPEAPGCCASPSRCLRCSSRPRSRCFSAL